ncbi:MAG: SusD/RagB family nutrient-binding outer membrane lipoprotein [Kaistella sp.]|nr:SusD/RagB family nutrient-binding outer membrane lipoprotein [Kaistella sp.]
MKKILNKLVIGALAAISLTSCQRDLLSLNEDPKHPSTLPSETHLAMGQQQFFYYTHTGSVNFNNYRFFVQQWAETTYTDETNYDLVTRNQPRNHWNRMYVYSLNNYENAKKNLPAEAVNSPAERTNKMATLEISQIVVWENLVNTYGDIPYFDALKAGEGNFAPKYDDDKAIYTDLLARINAVVSTIDEGAQGYGTGDLVYGGDMTKWKHLANSVKLRLAMNLADTNAVAAKAAAESAIAGGVISSDAESYTLHFAGGTFNNPIFDDLVSSGRNDFVPSEKVINMMNAKNDPRRAEWFTTVGGDYVGGVFGSLNPFNGKSHLSDFFLASDGPAAYLSYVEVLFMKAEAAQRGFSVGGTAVSFYNGAVTESMISSGVSSADAATYLAAHPYDAVNWKKSIGEEAWIALFDSPFAAWNFSRRLDNPVFVNPPGSKIDGVPVRMPYSDQEYVLNKGNVNAAASAIGGDKATTKLFWDVN